MATLFMAGSNSSCRGYGCCHRFCRYCCWRVQASRASQRAMAQFSSTPTPNEYRGNRGIHQWLWQCWSQRFGIGTCRNDCIDSTPRITNSQATMGDNRSMDCGTTGVLLTNIFCLPLSARPAPWRTSRSYLGTTWIMDISPRPKESIPSPKLKNVRHR